MASQNPDFTPYAATLDRGFAQLNLSDPAFSDTADWLPPLSSKPKSRLERYRAWKDTIAAAHEHQPEVIAVLEKAGVEMPRSLLNGRIVPPGLTNQRRAAEEREWRAKMVATLRRKMKMVIRAQRLECFTFAATFARPDWIIPSLDRSMLLKIRKFVQRQAKRLKLPNFVSGIVDVCPMWDQKSEIRGWAFHVHLTILVGAPDEDSGHADIIQAFPYKSDGERGVPNASDVRLAYDPRGWDNYQDKLLQWGGVVQRITRVDPITGNRLNTHQPPMSVAQQQEFARFMMQVEAKDFMIWVGHKRYGDRVLKMPCNRSKTATPQSSPLIAPSDV